MTREWYFQVMGQDVGPLSAAELKGKVTMGQVQPDTLVRKGAEGKWVFAVDVKGLIPVAPEPPAPPPAPVQLMPKVAARIEPVVDLKAAWISSVPASIRMVDDQDDDEGSSSAHEFYNFVGFRDAISHELYDAVNQFVSDCGITLSQMNRYALAEVVGRPDLGGNLMIAAVTPYPDSSQREHEHADGICAAPAPEIATAGIRISVGNRSRQSIQLLQAVFVPIQTQPDDRDSKGDFAPRVTDEANVISVRLGTVVPGKVVRFAVDEFVTGGATSELLIKFQQAGPTSIRIEGKLLLASEHDFAISHSFWIRL